MAKTLSILLIALFGFSQVTTQTVPDLEILLDLNGDATVNVADVVLLTGFILSGQDDNTLGSLSNDELPCFVAGVAFGESLCPSAGGGELFRNGALDCDYAQFVVQIGSSTVFPFTQLSSIEYINPFIAPIPYLTGSGLGFRNFFTGGSDVSSASRALKASDYTNAGCDVSDFPNSECNGRLASGVLIGRDKLSVIANDAAISAVSTITGNPPDISDSDLTQLIIDAVTNGTPELFVPDFQSGTFDFFADELGLTTADFGSVVGFVDDIELTTQFASFMGAAIAVVPFAEASRFLEQIPTAGTFVSINGIAPDDASQTDNYFFTRPLFQYYDLAETTNFQTLDYLCALLESEGQETLEQVGYLPLSEMEVAQERAALNCDQRTGFLTEPVSLFGPQLQKAFCEDSAYLLVIGSSTVFPVTRDAARIFLPTFVTPIARSTGSTIGILDLIAGAASIGAASRAIRESDYEEFNCPFSTDSNGQPNVECQGVLPFGIEIGTDSLSVVINEDNVALNNAISSVGGLDFADLQVLFADGPKNFEDAPSLSGFPGLGPVNLYIPDVNSGTFGFFADEVDVNLPTIGGFPADEDIAANIIADPQGLGFFGVAFAAQNQNGLNVVPLAEDSTTDSFVDPISGNINAYPLSRPLFAYYDASPDAFNKQRNEFLCFLISPQGQDIVARVGYSGITSEQITAAQDRLFCEGDATI